MLIHNGVVPPTRFCQNSSTSYYTLEKKTQFAEKFLLNKSGTSLTLLYTSNFCKCKLLLKFDENSASLRRYSDHPPTARPLAHFSKTPYFCHRFKE